jgi:hypothetical protein
MISSQLRCTLLSLGVVLASSVLAAGNTVYQTEAPTGSVELTNLGSETEVAPAGSSVVNEQAVEPTAAAAAATDAAAVQAVAPAVAASKAESADAVAERASKYRDQMLNAKAMPNGKPVNPAVQRRYLMVKKSDYVAGQTPGQ